MMSNLKVFISRPLPSDSPFKQKRSNSFEIIDKSLIRFEVIPFIDLPDSDWYFFYSQKGAYYFFEQLSKLELDYLKNKKIAAFGPATAGKVEHYLTQDLDFIGSGMIEQVNQSFKMHSKNASVCFVRALNSKKSIHTLLSSEQIQDLIVYSNEIDLDITVPNCHYYLLTSSMNAEALFNQNKLNLTDSTFISIGPSTSKTLVKLGARKVITTESPSEQGLYETLMKCTNSAQ